MPHSPTYLLEAPAFPKLSACPLQVLLLRNWRKQPTLAEARTVQPGPWSRQTQTHGPPYQGTFLFGWEGVGERLPLVACRPEMAHGALLWPVGSRLLRTFSAVVVRMYELISWQTLGKALAVSGPGNPPQKVDNDTCLTGGCEDRSNQVGQGLGTVPGIGRAAPAPAWVSALVAEPGRWQGHSQKAANPVY